MMDGRVVRMLLPVAAVVAIPVAIVLVVVGLFWPVAIVVGVLAGAVAALLVLRRADAAVLKGLPSRAVDEDDEPRLHNILDGLCDSHGFQKPVVVVIDDDGANACVFGRDVEHGTLAITRGLVATLDRMQLEGVLARELAVLDDHRRPAATVAVALRSVLPRSAGERLVRDVVGAERAVRDDLEAVRLTRYPPGLASALAAIGGSATVRAANPAGAHLWMVDPVGAGDETDGWALDARVDALREL
jgi:hypothetical protein